MELGVIGFRFLFHDYYEDMKKNSRIKNTKFFDIHKSSEPNLTLKN